MAKHPQPTLHFGNGQVNLVSMPQTSTTMYGSHTDFRNLPVDASAGTRATVGAIAETRRVHLHVRLMITPLKRTGPGGVGSAFNH